MHEWYNYYYHHNNNKHVIPALKYFFSAKFSNSQLKLASLQGFFSSLFAKYPEQAEKWLIDSQLTPKEKKPLLMALAIAGLDKLAIRIAKKDEWSEQALKYLSNPLFSINANQQIINNAYDIGFFWGAFKASGDKKYLDTLINILIENIQLQETAGSENIVIMIMQTLQHHRSYDNVINNHFINRYAGFDTDIQAELDLLIAGLDEEDSSPDCD